MERGRWEAPGTYASFADVAKAYDQVWRDGLYLTLYSMGVRGAMWHIIQEWLNNATCTACTTWNGVRGPTVVLEEGLCQGCVLSPILYCIFNNWFLTKKPVDIPVPEYVCTRSPREVPGRGGGDECSPWKVYHGHVVHG